MPPISVLMKPASSMCNMRCDYCFYSDEAQKRTTASFGFMEETTLKNVIRRTLLQADGGASYVYQGGEPTLRGLDFFEKAVQYQKQYNKKNLFVSNAIQTNGYALDEEWCRFLKKNHFLVGFSVDGTEEIHNTHRHSRDGRGTYGRVRTAARLLDQYGVDYNILTVVTADAASHIEEIYEEYRRNGWKYQQYIPCLDPLDEEGGGKEFSLTPRMYGEFLIALFERWYEDYQKGRQPYIRSFVNYINLAAGYQAEACDQRGRCSLQYVVEADGSVYPCDFYMLDAYNLGNFNADRLCDIDRKRKEIGFAERSEQLEEECISCPHYFLCRGGCQRCRDFYPESGRYKNRFCEGYRMFFETCGERMQKLAKE